MQDLNNEIATVKTKRHRQEFEWKKRTWAIPDFNSITSPIGEIWHNPIITDKKGIGHIFVEVNEADGVIRMLPPTKQNIIDDKCTQCGGKISIDAMNIRNLTKRKTINTFWGIDNTYVLLLLVIAIMAIGALGFAFYLFGENSELRLQLEKAKPVAKMILIMGGIYIE